LGQGFGIPLTNWTVSKSGAIIREPHNSFLSVFARTGIVGIIIWSIFHLVFNIRIFLFLRKNLTLTRNNYFVNFLLCSYLAFLGSYIWALSQPYFEIPQYAISAYIAVGLIISLYKQTYSRITKCAL
jgi:O-antigen ligase